MNINSILKRYYYLFTLNNIPVHAHWSVLLAIIFVIPMTLAVGIKLVFTLLFLLIMYLAHEMGHATFARHYQYDVDKIEISILHGSCHHDAPEYEHEEIMISWGGVIGQALLLLPALILRVATGHYEISALNPFFFVFIYLNLYTIAINLLPIPGLDGSMAWKIIPYLLANMSFRIDRPTRPMKQDRQKTAEEITSEIMEQIRKKANES